MGRYRDRLQIVADILAIASRGAKKTWIMYQANLSYKLLCKYLDEVLECGLVRVDDKEDCYVVAPKGEQFLEKFSAYAARRERVKEELGTMRKERALLEKMYTNTRVRDSERKFFSV